MNDPVKHPAHYTQGKIEVWDFIVDQRLGYLAGNVIKYVCRHEHKGNPLQDLQKARAYLDRLIDEHERDQASLESIRGSTIQHVGPFIPAGYDEGNKEGRY